MYFRKKLLAAVPILFKQHTDSHGEIGIWKVEEDETFFLSRLDIYPEEEKELALLKDRKRIEWLSSRYLLHFLSGREIRGACLKDEYGKPYLKDSLYSISMSHSRDLTAIFAGPQRLGVDIQYTVEKIARIAPKFVSETEYDLVRHKSELNDLHFIWGAKECLFKAYGKGNVDFKRQLKIMDSTFTDGAYTGTGRIIKDDFQGDFRLIGRLFTEYILVYAYEI